VATELEVQMREDNSICQHCGKTFYADASRLRKGEVKYCSRPCKYQAMTFLQKITASCATCGVLFQTTEGRIKENRGRYCSRSCKDANQEIPLAKCFWSRVKKTDTCWLWTGKSTKAGYGQLSRRISGVSTTYLAHRLSWELHNGPIPEGLLALHKCDNPPCVNPDHLFLGTHADNSQDMVKKGRSCKAEKNFLNQHPEVRPKGDNHYMRRFPERVKRGENNIAAVLTDDKVREIRRRYIPGKNTLALAKEYGVDSSSILNITKRRTWKHLD
jgi:hypothetical protein